MGTPLGARGPGLNRYAVGREVTGVGFPCLGPDDLYPGDVLGSRAHSVFDGDGAICLEPQRGGLR